MKPKKKVHQQRIIQPQWWYGGTLISYVDICHIYTHIIYIQYIPLLIRSSENCPQICFLCQLSISSEIGPAVDPTLRVVRKIRLEETCKVFRPMWKKIQAKPRALENCVQNAVARERNALSGKEGWNFNRKFFFQQRKVS